MRLRPIIIAALLLGACGPTQPADDGSNQVPHTDQSGPPPASPAPPPQRSSLPEPRSPIDPKSVEAAGQVVQHYGALIEQRRWREAGGLWGDRSAADAFARELKADHEVHLEIGQFGQPEGAAGSIYLSMLVVFYGSDRGGKSFRRPADIVLRRINDVPGSTEAQRRWHIERIDWKAAA